MSRAKQQERVSRCSNASRSAVLPTSLGPHAGKLVAIVDVIDQNRVKRQAMPFMHAALTDYVISTTEVCEESREKAQVNSEVGTKQLGQEDRGKTEEAKMSDFDRHKVMKAKRMRNKIIKHEVKKLQKEAAKK
ncbi:60S ribosomal protein L14 [Lates japonicus]|uniref:Large ribosomal subunit protein eL14 n=1 Tax=Lates japonicus TaxID=270547 RepID=A0AAD3NQ94_LATJO|nr:60S ribosomal protein L14 [Lates japonicus]